VRLLEADNPPRIMTVAKSAAPGVFCKTRGAHAHGARARACPGVSACRVLNASVGSRVDRRRDICYFTSCITFCAWKTKPLFVSPYTPRPSEPTGAFHDDRGCEAKAPRRSSVPSRFESARRTDSARRRGAALAVRRTQTAPTDSALPSVSREFPGSRGIPLCPPTRSGPFPPLPFFLPSRCRLFPFLATAAARSDESARRR